MFNNIHFSVRTNFLGGNIWIFSSPIEITDTNIEMKNHILYGDYAEISGIAHNTGNNMLTVTIGAKCYDRNNNYLGWAVPDADGIIGKNQLLFVEYILVVLEGNLLTMQTNVVSDFRIIIHQCRTVRPRSDRRLSMQVSKVNFALDSINPFGIGMKPVKTQFVLHPKPYHKAGCQTDGQTG